MHYIFCCYCRSNAGACVIQAAMSRFYSPDADHLHEQDLVDKLANALLVYAKLTK